MEVDKQHNILTLQCVHIIIFYQLNQALYLNDMTPVMRNTLETTYQPIIIIDIIYLV